MSAATAGQTANTAAFITTLQSSGVSGEALDAARAAQQASEAAATAWQRAHTELVNHGRVGEAYAANPGAGSREFLTADAGPVGGGSARSEAGMASPEPAASPRRSIDPVHQPTPGRAKAAAPRDTLKLAGRVDDLDPGETLVGSGKVVADSGTVRLASTDLAGQRYVRLGLGGPGFGDRDDEAGPWRAGRDKTDEINVQRRTLRDESDQIEGRLAEIEAADRIAALRADNPTATLADLIAERDRVHARLDEINEHDMAVNRARARQAAGEAVDPAELNPPPYCEPGEYDRLRARRQQLADLPDPDEWDDEPRPAAPGEVDALERRYDKLDELDTTEVTPGGYTAKLDAQAAGQLRSALADGLGTAEQTYLTNNAVFNEIDRLETIRDSLRGMGRKWTDDEDKRWDDATEQIETLEAKTATFDYTIFAEGVVPGQWADVHYRVDLDDYDTGVQVALGAVPHGSDRDLSDLSGYEQSATLDPGEAKKVVHLLDRHLGGGAPDGLGPPQAAPAAAAAFQPLVVDAAHRPAEPSAYPDPAAPTAVHHRTR
jgi:hypothetical protein